MQQSDRDSGAVTHAAALRCEICDADGKSAVKYSTRRTRVFVGEIFAFHRASFPPFTAQSFVDIRRRNSTVEAISLDLGIIDG